MSTKKIVVFGLGQRGNVYASFAKKYPEKFELVAIIENNPDRIGYAKKQFPNVKIYEDYRVFVGEGVKADIVAVSTQDSAHKEHAIAMMEAGYDLLLEKPIANTREECIEIFETSKRCQRKVIVCHVLRYSQFYASIKREIDEGKLGEVITIHASENVGYYHQAHSYIRGPWRNTKESSPMILAKCCHDMDILRYLMGEKCESVSSYGSLFYFNEQHAPQGSTAYCSECKVEKCPFNAQKIYTSEEGDFFANYFTTKEHTRENVLSDLKHSAYDRCVFRCDNDVVDHQVTAIQFANGKTATHSMTAFSQKIYRDIKIHGTNAELVGVMEDNCYEIRYFDGRIEKINVDVSAADVGYHNGSDFFMMNNLYKEMNGEKAEGITYLDVSIESHLMSFAAEKSRLNKGCAVKI